MSCKTLEGGLIMSRSYRKPYSYWIVIKPTSVRNSKSRANRRYRRKMNQRYYDDCKLSPTAYKRIEDIKWYEDLAKHYWGAEGSMDDEWYRKMFRK